jgi:gamma-glutamyl-gamma-aminobutyrate hydrolase PuuD
MTATTAAAELGSAHRDDFDAGLAQQCVCVGVTVIGHNYARLERDDVVAIIPLLALGLPRVSPGLNDLQRVESQRVLYHLQQRRVIGPNLECAVGAGRVDAVASDVIDHFAENRALVAIAEAEHRIEMHRRTALRHYAGNHPRRSIFPEQAVHDLADGLMRRALAHADQHDACRSA